jgi:hypothetical protein
MVSHVVVVYRERMFEVQVIDLNTRDALPYGSIFAQLAAVMRFADASYAPSPVAASAVAGLTAGRRDSYFRHRCQLSAEKANADAFLRLDTALFVLCLEDDVFRSNDPTPLSERSLRVFCGGPRWFDKLNVVVSSDACVAVLSSQALVDEPVAAHVRCFTFGTASLFI